MSEQPKRVKAFKEDWIKRAVLAEMEAHNLRIEVYNLKKQLESITVWQIIKRKVFGK